MESLGLPPNDSRTLIDAGGFKSPGIDSIEARSKFRLLLIRIFLQPWSSRYRSNTYYLSWAIWAEFGSRFTL